MNINMSTFTNDELLDELVFAYENMRDYVYRSDWVKWSQEAEDKATEKYTKLKEEALRRMGDLQNED